MSIITLQIDTKDSLSVKHAFVVLLTLFREHSSKEVIVELKDKEQPVEEKASPKKVT